MAFNPNDVPTAANVLRAYAADTQEYTARFGEDVLENFDAWVNGVLDYPEVQNSFVTYLINKIGRTYVNSFMAKNPLAFLRGEDLPYGSTIEDIWVEIQRGYQFDPEGKGTLDRYLPDVKVLYYVVNSDLQYAVSISTKELKLAFTRAGQMDALLSRITNSLYQSARHDMFLLMKRCIAEYNGHYKVKVPAFDETSDTAKSVGKTISTYVLSAQFDRNDFNSAGVTNNVPDGEGILIMTVEARQALNFDYLANVFQIDRASLESRIVLVDNFGELEGAVALYADRRLFQNHFLYEGVETQRNAKGRFTNYFLNEEAIYAMSKYMTSILFTTDTLVTVSFNANGGTGSMGDRYTEANTAIGLPFNSFVAPAGKKFKGWSTTSAGTNIIPQIGAFTPTEDTTIYAIWE